MLTYEYVCDGCGHTFDTQQEMTADPLQECPKCEAMKLRRVISGGVGFVLKGGGWYRDGYGKNPPRNKR